MTATPPRSLRVLLIEDEATIAMTIEFSIECLGQEVIGPYAHLQDAMTAAMGDDYDCAIIDINIVGGASHDVARTLIANRRPFILASGYKDMSLPEDLRNLPRLMKPFSGEQLEHELERMFELCRAP